MGYAKYVGRVGVLAVALGIGTGMGAVPAWATPAGSGSSSDAGSSGSSGSSPSSSTGSAGGSHAGASGAAGTESAGPASAPATKAKKPKAAPPKNKKSTKPDAAGGDAAKAPKPAAASKPSSDTGASTGAGATTNAATSANPPKKTIKPAVKVGASTAAVAVGAAAAPAAAVVATTPTNPATPVLKPTAIQTVAQAVTSFVSRAVSAFASVFGISGGSNIPVESPAAALALAAARKELSAGQKVAPVAAVSSTGQTAPVPAAGTTVVNEPPAVNPTVNAADPTTGTVTGQLNAVDPEGKKLTYTVSNKPTQGTLTFDGKTGSFTYKPTAAQRVVAAVTQGGQSVSFNVTVSDGVKANNQVQTVTITVAPAPISDLGNIATGDGATKVVTTNTRAFVVNYDAKTVTVIDTIHLVKLGDIAMDNAPTAVAVTPDGKKLYATDDTTNTISVYDVSTGTGISKGVIDFGGNRYPDQLAIGNDGKTLYATGATYNASTDTWTPVVTKVSTTTDKITGTVKLPNAIDTFYDIVVAPNGQKIYVIADMNQTNTDTGDPWSGMWVFSPTATSAKLVAYGTYFIDMAISPDSKRVYISDVSDGYIGVFNSVTNKFDGSIATVPNTTTSLAVSSDGSVLYAVNSSTNEVVAYNTATFAQISTTAMGSATGAYYPDAALSPDGQQFYYTSDAGLQIVSLVPGGNTTPVVGTSTSTGPAAGTGVVTGSVGVTDGDNDKLTYTATPAKGTIVFNADGSFTYTPSAAARHAAAAFGATDALTDTFTVTVDDGRRGIVTQTVTVDIAPANNGPTGKTTVGSPNSSTSVVKGNVTGTDKDKDALTYAVVDVVKGSVVVDAKGNFVYTPTAQARHDAAAVGATTADKTGTFTINISDGHGGVTTVPVVVKILGSNAKPVLASTTGAGDSVTGAVIGTATDADLDALVLTGPASTKKGTVVYHADGTFTYTPTQAARDAASVPGASLAARTDSFAVTVTDGHGGKTTTTVKVTIVANVTV